MIKPSLFPQGETSSSPVRQMRKHEQPHARKLHVRQPLIATVQQKPKQPIAPPVYRPQLIPQVLQRKAVIKQPPLAAGQTKPAPAAPPVYRPQPTPKVLQRTIAQGQSKTTLNRTQPMGLPAHQPQPAPKVLQIKKPTMERVTPQQGSALLKSSPVYKPNTVPQVLQAKSQRTPHQTPIQQQPRPGALKSASGASSIMRCVAAQTKTVRASTPAGRRVIQRMRETPSQSSPQLGGQVAYNELWLRHDDGAKCQHVIQWKLSPHLGNKSGFIIQQVTLIHNGSVIDSYYEAWEVKNGIVEDGKAGATDQFTFGPFTANLSGSILASAEFIETDEPYGWSKTAIVRSCGLRASQEPPGGWTGGGLKRTFIWKTGEGGTYSLSFNGTVLADTIPIPDYYGGGVAAPDWKNQVAATRIWFERFATNQSRSIKQQRLQRLLQDSVHEGFGTLAQAIDTIVDQGDQTVIEFLNELLETFGTD
jgi:hypothetical protein